jgi:carboxyl-terminal processing protease
VSVGAAAQTISASAKPEDVLERYVSALGGRDAFGRTKTTEVVREREQFGTTSRVYRVEEQSSRRFYQRADTPDGIQETGYDGSRMWAKRSAFRGYMTEDENQVKVFRSPEPDPREYRESGRKYTRLADEMVDGKSYIVLEGVQHQPIGGDVPVKFYFDPKTFLLVRRAFGNVVSVTQTFADYRAVDAIMIPFLTTIAQPNGTATVRTISVRHNVTVADSLFAFRAEAPPVPFPTPTAPPGETGTNPALDPPLSDSLRLATFEFVWRRVNETHWDTTFGGVDWRAVYDRYRPLVLATPGSRAFHDLLGRMTRELHISHFNVIGPAATLNLNSTASDVANLRAAHPGIELRSVAGQLLVTYVDTAYPAFRAGVRPGFVLTKINGRPVDSVFGAWRRENPMFELPRVAVTQAAQQAMRGRQQDSVTLDLLDDRGRAVTRRMPLAAPAHIGMVAQFDFESRRIVADVGYIRFNLFFADAVARVRRAVEEFGDTRGIVLDLRGNPGGVGEMSSQIASLFSADSGSLGRAKLRYNTRDFTFRGTGPFAYRGKLIILVDSHSGSTSEVLTAGLQDIGRATVIGDTTAGAVLPANVEMLPTGGTFQYPIADFHTPRETVLEGRGVIPDIVQLPSAAALLAGHDLALERALTEIRLVPRSPAPTPRSLRFQSDRQ